MKDYIKHNIRTWLPFIGCTLAFMFFSLDAAAAPNNNEGWGGVAQNLTGTFESLGNLITGGSYLAGLGFSIGAIMKFKQHKDNPSQTPVGTPIALVFIAAALLFLPSVLSATGISMFGGGAQTAGPKGGQVTTGGGFTPAK